MNFININNLQNSIPAHKVNMQEDNGSKGQNKACQPISTPSFGNNYNAKATATSTSGGFTNVVSHWLDKGMRKIEGGGFFAEFLVLDVLGMMGPRTIQAYLRNKDELGHLNHKAGAEEATRELLTGPSFFVVPLTFLAASHKIFGSATKLPVDVLKGLHGIAEKAVEKGKGDNKEVIHEFYTGVVNQLYGDADKNHDAVTAFKDFHAACMSPDKPKTPDTAFGKFIAFFKKPEAQNITEAREKLKELIIQKNKNIGTDDLHGISPAYSSKMKFVAKDQTHNVSDIIENSKNYAYDVFKTLSKKIAEKPDESRLELFNKIHNNRVIQRIAVTVTGIATLSGVLYSIPMLYKQNKEFPGIDGLTETANDNNVNKKRAA